MTTSRGLSDADYNSQGYYLLLLLLYWLPLISILISNLEATSETIRRRINKAFLRTSPRTHWSFFPLFYLKHFIIYTRTSLALVQKSDCCVFESSFPSTHQVLVIFHNFKTNLKTVLGFCSANLSILFFHFSNAALSCLFILRVSKSLAAHFIRI